MKTIAVIGGGWYGCHIALSLKQKGQYYVTLYEAQSDIFHGCSGKFGIRLHAGPHYPRSKKTRESCQNHFYNFHDTYSDLLIKHEYSVYGLGIEDVDECPSKVTESQFKLVCKECDQYQEIDIKEWNYQHLISAFTVYEPSIAVGKRLREKFKKYLKQADVNLICNYKVQKIEKINNNKLQINTEHIFDHVINCTYYQDLTIDSILPFNIEVVYQPSLALYYEDNEKSYKDDAFSFIIMDGWFPCIMPHDDHIEGEEITKRKYIMTHGKYTIMGSFETYDEAVDCKNKLNDSFVEKTIKPLFEKDMNKYWPTFKNRFKYLGWISTIATKVKTEKEFRSALTWEKDGMIYVLSGKINNIFDAEQEVFSLLKLENILKWGGYNYVKDGELDRSINEVTEKPQHNVRNTSELQVYNELCSQHKHN
ncbi:unnamed protein product [Adineta steineri]|uniref:FAD dependent oxidoreductase domain-containing protein n=1 Tax=Adineta steineri TaxID=433720 RepID=A0A815KZU0_9BILA|nr:unnamed protein product [Adineta steineri]CAF1613893.1 unnamed protein product [Adineta steineri]